MLKKKEKEILYQQVFCLTLIKHVLRGQFVTSFRLPIMVCLVQHIIILSNYQLQIIPNRSLLAQFWSVVV